MASRTTRHHALSTTFARWASRPVRGHARGWSPNASERCPQPGAPRSPQVAGAVRGERRGDQRHAPRAPRGATLAANTFISAQRIVGGSFIHHHCFHYSDHVHPQQPSPATSWQPQSPYSNHTAHTPQARTQLASMMLLKLARRGIQKARRKSRHFKFPSYLRSPGCQVAALRQGECRTRSFGFLDSWCYLSWLVISLTCVSAVVSWSMRCLP